jgi:DUF1680 family protein
MVKHKMYLHGATGTLSAQNEGYLQEPYRIAPDDCYGESCAVCANFRWGHNLFRLTGDASYIDAAERMLYNAFYASLSLSGDRYFYCNRAEGSGPRSSWASLCCPPNIIKLLAGIGGFLYATGDDGIYVKHYAASEAEIPYGSGVKLIQATDYPWHGDVSIQVETEAPTEFTLRLRVPAWAASSSVSVNGEAVDDRVRQGWVVVRRRWSSGDRVDLSLSMVVERVTMPPEFGDYENLAALQRGPIVYCIEQQDSPVLLAGGHGGPALPEDVQVSVEHRPELLGGVTILNATLPFFWPLNGVRNTVPVSFVPYGVWANRAGTDGMMIWLKGRLPTMQEIWDEPW